MTQGFPECTALRLDPETRRSDGGRTLLGGSPLRLVRFRERGARIVDDLASGAPVGTDPVRVAVARRLLDAGLAHPVPGAPPPLTVSVVIPVGRAHGRLDGLLDALDGLDLPTIVVDDAASDPSAVAEIVAGRAMVIHHETNRGPAAARNTGWQAADSDLVAFVDVDVRPDPGWLRPLVAHFADPAVAAAAPRVRGDGGPELLARYEAHHSPLDMGPRPARVVPGGRVGYVPTAAVVFRRTVLDAMDGFDERMRCGEDVDLVWRTIEAGHAIRYEPASEVRHENRRSWPELAAQRRFYGSAAAALDRRHPGAAAPVAANVWSMVAWSLAALGGRRGALSGGVVAIASSVPLVRLLRDRTDHPVTETLRLAGRGHLGAGRWLAAATTRTWMPIAVVGALGSRQARRGLLTAAVVPNLVDWIDRRPSVDPVRWTAMRLLDDTAYCAGVWQGCLAERSMGALVPRLVGIEGVTERRIRAGTADS